MLTIDKLNKMLQNTGVREFPEIPGFSHKNILPHIQCQDGLKLSVQTASTAYCTPRDDYGPWTCVEVGFPTEEVEALMEYAEDPDNPTGTVYGYVPIQVVVDVVNANGGIKDEAS